MTSSPHAEALGRARTAADFAALIALLDSDLKTAADRKLELEKAKGRAMFGRGDLAAARIAFSEANAVVALLEKTREAANERRAAAQSEDCVDIAALADEIRANAASLDERWRMAHWLVEQLRQQLFDADALRGAVATANSRFDAAGVANLKINPTAVRRAAVTGRRATAPARLSAAAIQADRLLLSPLSPGGALDPRPPLGAPVGGIAGRYSLRGRGRG
ncbi:hypothetical protein [Mesorhizobium sp.]|uniref:hypothetical protein n=1 Tax=Mesorhizobium sp. TaxID=1871066 RepID=UPI000FE5E2A2|nr:hypothetical protein [Mesorhizobium sp.]RWO76739.1 MAG: hypothetical protein EOQ95_32085 [Mesorhizobium sp.]